MSSDSTCEICDRTDSDVEYWKQGIRAHISCVPGYWKRDRADYETFTAALHRVRYELGDNGMVEAACLKCDWRLVDWPNRVGDLYRKAQEHDKGESDSF